MANPWTKKNPLLSMWLSAANQSLGTARGTAQAAARRQVATAQTDAMRQIMDFWGASAGLTKPKSRRR
jgi:hypothetical protein